MRAARPARPAPRRRRRAFAVLTVLGTLAAGLVPVVAASAAEGDDLDVRFGGSLVGTSAYTTTEGEAMRGVLRRVAGGEEQLPGGGVRLGGGTQGLRFDSADVVLDGPAPGFVAEMEVTPTGVPADMATYLSAGGNLFVRAQGGQLVYGFETTDGSAWTSHRASAPLPAAGTAHRLSVQYVDDGGTAALHVWLDGSALPTVTADDGAAVHADAGSAFGFGHEVHPSGAGRGLRADVARVRVLGGVEAYDPALFLLQPAPLTHDLLDVGFDGTTAGAEYTTAAGETLDGSLTLRGGASTSGGSLRLASAAQAADFTATTPPSTGPELDRGFVAEAEFTATTAQADLATVLAVGGNLFVRYRAGSLQYGFSSLVDGAWQDRSGTTALPATGRSHVVSLAYEPGAESTTLTVWLDGTVLPPVTGPSRSTRSAGATETLAIGNEVGAVGGRAFVGSVDRARFALLLGPFEDRAFRYQQRDEPVPCAPLGPVVPGPYVPVDAGDCADVLRAKAALVRPTEAQVDWQDLGLTAFLHFGINTFYDQEWGHGTEDLSRFRPTGELDVDSWVRTLRDTGHRMAILTVKHHDGFMLYPSRYTTYDVASTPWQDGEGDVVRAFVDAAHRYGMKVGFYLSPADSHEEVLGVYGNGSPKTPRTIPTLVEGDDRAGQDLPTFTYPASDYGAHFLNTLYELLTEYGPVDEVWFDGSNGNTGKREYYDYPAFYDLIGELQPDAVVAVGGRDVRWVGNEAGVARQDEWAPVAITDPGDGGKIDPVDGGSFEQVGSAAALVAAAQAGADALHWWPTESDMKLTPGWFAHPGDTPKSGAALLGHYLGTTGRNSVMLLNTPPTTTGSFAPASTAALESFAALRRQAFTRDHALGLPVTVPGGGTSTALTDGNSRSSWVSPDATAGDVVVDLGTPRTVSRLEVGEDVLDHGQVVEQLSVDAEVDGRWVEVGRVGTVGQRRVVTFSSPVTAQRFRVSVDAARGPWSLATLALYEQLATDPGRRSEVTLDCAADAAGDGSAARPFRSLEQFRQTELAPGATVHLVAGGSCADSGTPFWGYGTADAPITVDVVGAGPAPTFGSRTAEQVFGPLAAQGWELACGVRACAPEVAFGAEVRARCVGTAAVLAVRATNDATTPVTFTVGTPYGTRTIADVAPGKSGTPSFTSRQVSVPAGTVEVQARAVVDGTTRTGARVVAYDALDCG